MRLYDVDRGWRLRKNVSTRMMRWTITDTSLSPDQRLLLYASIVPAVHLVGVGSSFDDPDSTANVTEVHDRLDLDGGSQQRERMDPYGDRSFGVW